MSIFNNIYRNSPVYFQNVFVSAYGYYWKHRRYGGNFNNYVKDFKARESLSVKKWKKYQTIELRKILVHAFLYVPYYNEKYREAGFSIKDFESFEMSSLSDLPYLEKDDLRKFGITKLLAENKMPGQCYSSSGSTGTPTQIYLSKETHRKWSALYEARVRNWAGVNFLDARAMIGGRRVLPTSKMKPPYYRFNSAEKQAYFSAYHISKETVVDYVNGLILTKSEYLVGYAMSIYLLASYINQMNLKAPKLRAVLTSSEKLTMAMRLEIENAFQCKAYDGYSGVEACGLISENDDGKLLFSPDSGIMELVDENGNYVKNGEPGEVIATGFLNYDQPLIRYRIGDTVSLYENQDTNSNCHMPIVKEINGRVEDVLVGVKGQKMVRFHGIFVDIPSIKMAQIVQHRINLIEIKLVTNSCYHKKHEKVMIDRIQSQLGKINVKFTYINEIERTKNGKFRAVISMLHEE